MNERQFDYPSGRLTRRRSRKVADAAPIFEPTDTMRPATAPQTQIPCEVLLPAPIESEILAVLDSAVDGETIAMTYQRREHELRGVFARLTVAESRGLQRRLSIPAPGDVLAARFNGMIAERCQRLLAFLGDARRREALGRRQG